MSSRPGFWWRWVLTTVLLTSWVSAVSGEPLSAAILDWTVDDDHYASHREAARLTGWLEAGLLGEAEYRWVERASLEAMREELSLANTGGFAEAASWLRVGLWVRADVLITGRAVRSRRGWTLEGQVIDVERADVLASWVTRVAGQGDKPLNLAELDNTAWLASAREAIERAGVAYAESRRQVAVAVLHFENTTDVGRRLDHVEYMLERALPGAFEGQDGVRLLRFPGARRATAEHELVLSGLVEGEDAVRRLADVYVWGQYREVDWQGVPFRQVPIEFTLNLWDGRGEPVERVFRGRADELPQLVERVIRAVLEWSREQEPGNRAAHGADVALRVSQRLQDRARRLQDINRGNEHNITNAYRHRWSRAVRLLEMAYFFDADNADLHRELLAERYRDDLVYLGYTAFPEGWRQAALDDEIQHHINRFGFGTTWPTLFPRRGGGFVADNRFPDGGRMSTASLSSIRGPLKNGAGLRDTPRSVRRLETARYREIASRRARAALQASPDLETLNSVITLNLGNEAQLTEEVWPILDRRVTTRQYEWRARTIRRVFKQAGREADAERLIAQLEQVDPPGPRRGGSNPDALPPDTGPFSDNLQFASNLAQLAAPEDGWPPRLDTPVQDITLPRFSFEEFPQVWRHGDSLWVNLQFYHHGRNRSELNTWRYTPADGK